MPEEDNRTPEQRRMENLEGILTNEFHQEVIGSTTITANPHKFGEFGYKLGQENFSGVMYTEDAKKIAEREEKKDKERGMSQLAPASYYVESKVREMREEAFQGLSLKRLEKTVKSVVKGLKFSVPKELKDYVPMEFMVRIAEKQAQNQELSRQEIYVISTMNYLRETYDTYLATQQISKGHVERANEIGKRLNEAYQSKE